MSQKQIQNYDEWVAACRKTKQKRFAKFHQNLDALKDLAEFWSIEINVFNYLEHVQLICGEYLANYYPSTRRFFFQRPQLLPTITVAPENVLLAFLRIARNISEPPEELFSASWNFESAQIIPDNVLHVGSYVMPNVREEVLRLCAYKEDLIKSIDPREFEHMVAELLKSRGYSAQVTKASRDNGKDIIAIKEIDGQEYVLLVECKRWLAGVVGIDIVQRAVGVKYIYGADHFGIVTTARFTEPAINEAKKVIGEVSLVDGNALLRWIKAYEKSKANNALHPNRDSAAPNFRR